MKIGGLQKVSLIDYPGRICAVMFTRGCNFRCPYCHNAELVDPSRHAECLDNSELLAFLARRRRQLDAVTVTGGEPTLQGDLIPFVKQIREFSFLVKLDTNGSRPSVLEKMIDEGLVNYIAMDLKGPLDKYSRIAGSDVNREEIKRSIDVIMSSGIDYEFRTTVAASLLTSDDLLQMSRLIRNARLFVLQAFVPSKTLDPSFMKEPPFPMDALERIRASLEKELPCIRIR